MTRLRMTCARCSRPMQPKHIKGDVLYHAGRGLCTRCYTDLRRHGGLDDYAIATGHWSEYADDYAMLRDQGYPLDTIADRLQMTASALDKALCRHRDDPRARRPRRSA